MDASEVEPVRDRQLVAGWLAVLRGGAAEGLRLRDEGVCAVGHVSGLDCAVEAPGDGSVYLRTPLMPWRAGADGDLAERCLALHFLGLQTDGACFAIDRDEAALVLWTAWPLSTLDGPAFIGRMAAFMETAARWRDEFTPRTAAPDMPADDGAAVLLAERA